MATNTTNYGWTKPDYEDDADIAVLNETFDAIDAQVKTIETALNSKQTALSTAQLAAVNSGITATDVTQIETNKNNISLLRTFMAYVGYSEVIKVEKQVDNPNRIKFYIQSYYNGDISTVKTGCLIARSLPLNTDLTVDNAEADTSLPGLVFNGTTNDSRGDGLGVSVKPYIEISGERHYGVQQRYFYSDLT